MKMFHQYHYNVILIIIILLSKASYTFCSKKSSFKTSSPYFNLAHYLYNHDDTTSISTSRTINDDDDDNDQRSLQSLIKDLQTLSKSQSTFKNIDGASHEFYQRSHHHDDEESSDNKSNNSSRKNSSITGITGRAERTANRIGACADALFGCELLDEAFLLQQQQQKQQQQQHNDSNVNDVNEQRKVIFNSTTATLNEGDDNTIPLRVIVMYEESYNGGAGIQHGGINGLLSQEQQEQQQAQNNNNHHRRGRYFIIIQDIYENNLQSSMTYLDIEPMFIELQLGLVSGEICCVNPSLYKSASNVLKLLETNHVLEYHSHKDDSYSDVDIENDDEDDNDNANDDEDDNDSNKDKEKQQISTKKNNNERSRTIESLPAIHIVGRSLSGGVASLAALMLDGSIPMPKERRKRRSKSNRRRSSSGGGSSRHGKHSGRDNGRRRRHSSSKHQQRMKDVNDELEDEEVDKSETSPSSSNIHGFGKSRTSAVAIGAPPSISANIKASYITSILYGDDIICRTTKRSLDTLRKRIRRVEKQNVITKQMGWMTDALSLTISSIKSHAHGSEGEEGRLSIPGKGYLVRPRRIGGGVSSIHEIGNASGREALRAAVLWQLNDILLSRSMWKHHSFESYISGLDKVQLRQVGGGIDDEDEEYR